MEMSELISLSDDELKEKLGQFKKTLMQLRFQATTGKLERQSALKDTKKDIARILTALNDKKRGEAKK